MRIHHTDVQWAAIVSWGHPDGIIRVKNKRNSPAINFMHWNSNEQVHNFKQTENIANWTPLTLFDALRLDFYDPVEMPDPHLTAAL